MIVGRTAASGVKSHVADGCRACCAASETKAIAANHAKQMGRRQSSDRPNAIGDPVFSVDTPALRYGPGALGEVGEASKNVFSAKRVALFTDHGLESTEHVAVVKASLARYGIDVTTFAECRVEPTCESFASAARFVHEAGGIDAIVSVGGGSVMDTAKCAQLYAAHPPPDGRFEGDAWMSHFLRFVNAPVGGGEAPSAPLMPHIACPTTAGTGSESTGLAIFDLLSMKAKTGIATRAIRPALSIVDPNATATLPATVCAASAFDVLSHALESYTARSHLERPLGRPRDEYEPSLHRPMSQGNNKWADMGCLEALRLAGRYIVRAVDDASDTEAREGLCYASMLAGVAFGNVGCSAPHGMSYPVSGRVRDFQPDGYPRDEPIVPHGISVILNAPAVFRYTSKGCPERHLEAAVALGATNTTGVSAEDPEACGHALADRVIELMQSTGGIVPNGLSGVGYHKGDIDDLVAGALPQRRLLDNSPVEIHADELRHIYGNAMTYW